MILRDRITLVRYSSSIVPGTVPDASKVVSRQTVAAHVTHRDVEIAADDSRSPWTNRWSLTADIDPLPAEPDPDFHMIEWRGRTYALAAYPLVKRRGDQDHHWILELTRKGA